MTNYKKLNNIIGWAVFVVASFVYLATIEPTTSFWDCGEYIATAYKLEVGHPPGAPLFNLIGRFFTLFGGGTANAAMMVNALSAIVSAFTILFLFWTITALARKIALKTGELTKDKLIAIFGSGVVGALAYTFSDSFWFSAVEGEVYAMSSMFTAIVFWAILKWEELADEPHNIRWIVLIAFLMGLSIGVHLLNLLAIPAMTFIFYFKKYKTTTRNGFILAGILSVLILVIVQNGIIPGIVSLSAKFELFFTNSLGLPFNTGTIIYAALIIGGIIWGLRYTQKNKKIIANTAILCFTFILIGYSSFAVLIIRSQANTPMDENNPENAINLLSYLNREQYGSWPILHGQYFNAPVVDYLDGSPVYTKDEKLGKYVITDERKSTIPVYDPNFTTFFPRMHSSQDNHETGYRNWSDMRGTPTPATDRNGEQTMINKPTFGENLKFFFSYQVMHMYFRYFMWNFAGRQNDVQSHGGIMKGNWLSGIDFLDSSRIGARANVPEHFKANKGFNRFYMLPFILGLIGLYFHYTKDKKDAFVVTLLFFFTGMAIVIYLNQAPYQPRERDYAYAASFYAFAIWIGFGVYALYDMLKKKINATTGGILATSIAMLAAPVLMAKDGWDDHDRSGRYTARDFAFNYLSSCAPNAILFTNGDNDTFPLWYAQEVEGFRTDVRVVNLSLSNTDWYIEQMRRKAYDSDPIPLSLTEAQYRQGTRDYVPIYPNESLGLDTARYYPIKQLLEFVASEEPKAKLATQGNGELAYLPTNRIFIPVDSATVVNNGTVPKSMADKVVKGGIRWKINKSYILKNELMIFDILANNNWKRPVYFAITVGDDSYMFLQDYFQLEGLAYRLVPVNNISMDGQEGFVDTEIMYNNMMNKFAWGGMETGKIYMDENNLRMTYNLRNNFARLADALIREGKKDKAIKALDRAMQVMPKEIVPYNYFILPIAESYYKAGQNAKANEILSALAKQYDAELNYYFSLGPDFISKTENESQQAMSILQRMLQVTKMFGEEKLNKEVDAIFKKHEQTYLRYFQS